MSVKWVISCQICYTIASASHPNVGDIRGRGLFWGIEFVGDKNTARHFPADAHVAMELAELGLSDKYGISVYPCSGVADGVHGDLIIVSPAYNVTRDDIGFIVDTLSRLVSDFFAAKTCKRDGSGEAT